MAINCWAGKSNKDKIFHYVISALLVAFILMKKITFLVAKYVLNNLNTYCFSVQAALVNFKLDSLNKTGRTKRCEAGHK